ncbi:PepSY-associated TM helix domain-containing protein [Vibrio sp. HN007]|uniref:PepSY-associated TM helix domain-containing protein n=1 Tax=Vibrio iocasae TaxID=3098914 RepID=UPI0035D4D394
MSLKSKHNQIWFRRIHIYVSMALLLITLFFAVTGITLNRPELFEQSHPVITQYNLEVPTDVLFKHSNSFHPEKETLITFLRKETDVRGFPSDLDVYTTVDKGELIEGEVSMDFKGPGYNATVFVDMVSKEAEIEVTEYGVVALLNDLHKGRNSGEYWKWFIDITALLMVLFVLTGVCLLLPKKKTLNVALKWSVLGTLIAWAVYVVAVP